MKNLHRNIVVSCAVVCFAASGLFGKIPAVAAQTKSSAKTAKATPTPTKQQNPAAKSATTDKKKTTASNSGKTTAATATTTAVKSSTSTNKASSATKATANGKEKTAAKPPTKFISTAKTTQPPKPPTAAKISSTAKTNSTTKTSSAKTSSAKTAAPKTNAPTNVAASQIIVSATSARVRSEPAAASSVVLTLNVGRILPVVAENSIWYRVRLAGDRTGWISKQIAVDFDDAKRFEIYRQIAAKYLRNKMDFASAAQTFDFLTDASATVKKPNEQADLSLKRLQILSAALKAVPSGKSEQNPYKDFLKTNENEIVYSDPSGEWLVRSNVFWELHARFKETATGEEIAWAAAQTALPGECEGYVNCYLYLLRATDGEYLNFYPGGRYARKSIENIANLLTPIVADLKSKTVYATATDISDRAEFNRLLTELRQIISKTPFAEKARPIQQINQIGEGYR